ncbi:MAG: putative Ig domain-containing protein [Verrucomicrobiota bacterium]
MMTSLKLLGVTLACFRCWLFILGYTAALGVSHAQSGSFIIPGLRGEAASDFAYWDLFRNEPGKASNHNYDNKPALLDGLGEDDFGNLTSVTAKDRVFLRETATPTCFVTSSGALYSFAEPTAFEARYTPPADKLGSVTNVIFQTQTGGTRMDVNNIRLVYIGTTPTGPMTFEVAPNFKGLDDPQTGGFSERLVSAFQWDLTGRNVRDFKIVFASPSASMPLWQAQIDAVIGEPFVQELGFLLSTRSRPNTRFGRVGSIDKNLPPTADGRFFHQGEELNLLADPETGWMPTGWYYNGASSNGASLPLTFPGQDILVIALFAPQNYAAWRETMFNHVNSLLGTQDDYTNDAISAKTVDSDNDGLNNAGEYAFSGDVYTNDPVRWSPQMLRVDVGGVPHLAIRYRTNGAPANHADTVFKSQLSINGGGTWTDNSTVPTTIEHSRVLQSDGSAFVIARTVLPLSELPADAAMRIDWTASGVHGAPLAPLPLGITTNATLTAARVGVSYSANIVAAGGTAPYLWEVIAGALPAGLTLNSDTGLLSGLPSAAVSASFTVQITDANNLTVTKALQLSVQPFVITTASPLPSSLVNVPYEVNLAATGGTGPYTWSVSNGTLPAGLALSNVGVLSGSATAAAAGTTTFTVQITDTNQLTATKEVSVTFVNLVITTATSLPGAVTNIPYSFALTGSGGTGTYEWTKVSGNPPAGLSLDAAGVISGLPTEAVHSTFTVRLTHGGFSVTKQLTLASTTNFVKPVVNAVLFGNATIGANYSATLTAYNYPKTFTLTGLPKGLTYKSVTNTTTFITTCEISGRASVSGVFNVQVRATNDGGTSSIVTAPLVVKALPSNLVGTFSGIIGRNAAANTGLGSKFSLVTTTTGSFSLKITTGAKTTTTTGFLAAAAPQISITNFPGGALSLDLSNNLVDGTHGAASVKGWRSTWHAVSKPAATRDGYYSISLKLASEGNIDGVASIPQGHGYATFTVSLAGAVTVAGMTADGQKITSSDVMGPQGQVGMHALLYASKGTLLGQFAISEDADGGFLGNAVEGDVSWSKPATTGKVYSAAFALPVELDVEGGYLAAAAKGGIVLGLPEEGAAQLVFTDGGLADSDTEPNVGFSYTHDNKVVISATPAKVSLTINAATGAVSGKFTLTENTVPPLVRKDVPFLGQIVRGSGGSLKAAGYFLLPQIPPSGQKVSALTLSGGISIQQQ